MLSNITFNPKYDQKCRGVSAETFLACLLCISVTLWVHIPNPKFSLCMREVLQQLLADKLDYKLFSVRCIKVLVYDSHARKSKSS